MPPKKRPKIVDDDDGDDEIMVVIDKVWEHYRNYHESCHEEENEEGDMDELLELINLVEASNIAPVVIVSQEKEGNNASSLPTVLRTLTTRKHLLPIVASMAHLQLANNAITQTVDQHDVITAGEEAETARTTILNHLQESLRYFPYNCAAWSMGANYARMERLVSPTIIVEWYQTAAKYASALRSQAVEILEQCDDEDEDETMVEEKALFKEWIELLIIVDMVDAEFMDDNNDDNDNDVEDDHEEVEAEDEEVEAEDEDGYYSTSSVEAAARFMSAMLLSTLGKHDEARHELEHFDLTHRVHPNVWQGRDNGTTNTLPSDNQTLEEKDQESSTPTFFSGGVLPQYLYDKMCRVFAPDAAYWKESNYAHRGYYSYFFDINEDNLTTTNLVEDAIIHYLLPLAKQCLKKGKNKNDKIVGAEWWTHHRPIQANLGHNLHFDTDEAILAQEQLISHPVLSSVLYLTGGGDSLQSPSSPGPTIVFDQTPDSEEVATKCWTCVPKNNSFLIFDGQLLHGVLPCSGETEPIQHGALDKITGTSKSLSWSQDKTSKTTVPPHRLTFMVGFWTRRVPETMKNRTLYGPCGPLPDAKTTEWVRLLQENSCLKQVSGVSSSTEECKLVPISPAWETLESSNKDHDNNSSRSEPLDIPRALDHRFFVKDAPFCFRSSLFEKDLEETE